MNNVQQLLVQCMRGLVARVSTHVVHAHVCAGHARGRIRPRHGILQCVRNACAMHTPMHGTASVPIPHTCNAVVHVMPMLKFACRPAPCRLGKLALPLLLQYVIYSSSHMINTGFVGHLQDPVMLSSMVLATSLSMATGYSIISGIASATETLCGQAYGAKNYQAINDTLQRALLICGLACIPISFAWVNAEWILTHLGQPQDIAVGAARCVLGHAGPFGCSALCFVRRWG